MIFILLKALFVSVGMMTSIILLILGILTKNKEKVTTAVLALALTLSIYFVISITEFLTLKK